MTSHLTYKEWMLALNAEAMHRGEASQGTQPKRSIKPTVSQLAQPLLPVHATYLIKSLP
jgi:hypothetical protein